VTGSRRRCLATAWLVATSLAAHAAPPPPPPAPALAVPTRELRAAEQARASQLEAQKAAIARAQAASAEERRLSLERAKAAMRLRDLEQASAELADRVALLASRRAEAEARIAERGRALAPFLPIIERLSASPAQTLLALQQPPDQAIRGVLVLAGLTRRLELEAKAVRLEQANLADVQQEIDQALPQLRARQAAQASEAADLDARLQASAAARRAAEGEAGNAARRAAAEAARAETLRAAIARLEAAEAERLAEARAVEAKAAAARQASRSESRPEPRQEASARPTGNLPSLVAPAAGTISRHFGDAQDGGTSTSIAYLVPPSATVGAACPGRVVFAAPFRSFGLLTIIDCGSGWHAVLSGFDRLDTTAGQAVAAGERIGIMPAWDPLQLSSRPQLLLELRHDGQPVNPLPYLRARS